MLIGKQDAEMCPAWTHQALTAQPLWFQAWGGGGREDRCVFSWDSNAGGERQKDFRFMREIVEGCDKSGQCRDRGPWGGRVCGRRSERASL